MELQAVRQLVSVGRFGEALKVLDDQHLPPRQRPDADTLRAELLERLGNHGQSLALAERLLKARELSSSNRSACELVVARIKWESGDTDESVLHLQRSLSIAKQSADLERTCWAQLRLLIALADRSGPNATGPLFAELRANVIKLGDPQLSAALHIYVGELDAKRGLFDSGLRHTKVGERLLASTPNLWRESVPANLRFVTA